jgi:lipopolysaccharide transport system ATP-binding protein
VSFLSKQRANAESADDVVIRAESVALSFRVRHDRPTTIKEAVMRKIKRISSREEIFWALNDVTLSITRGERVGIIGLNGSGKTTFLSVIAGIYHPDRGRIFTKGRVVGLLGLGVGFDYEMTGRENIPLNASLYGLTRKEIEERADDIIAFADIGDFIDAPIKTYSSGMVSRLGFAAAAHLDADILLLDEVLAVGDAQFRNKCLERMQRLRDENKTLIFVGHELAAVEEMCTRVIWMEHGRIIADGPAQDIINAYQLKYDPAALKKK